MNGKSIVTESRIWGILAVLGLGCNAALGGLVHHLRFQDAAGDGTLQNFGSVGGTATKTVGNSGFYTNDVPPIVGGTWAWWSPSQGTATDAYVQLASSATTPPRLTVVGDQMSILAWVKMNVGVTGNRYLISHRQNGGFGWGLYVASKALKFVFYDPAFGTGATRTGTTANNVVPEGEWVHVAFTWESGAGIAAMKCYLNGETYAMTGTVPVGAVPNTSSSSYLRAFVQQSSNPSNTSQFVGLMDDLRLYDEVMTQDQIKEIMKPPRGSVFMIR